MNTPQPLPLRGLDLDTPMAPPPGEAKTHALPPAVTLDPLPMPVDDVLGLNPQAHDTLPPATKSKVLARLEEVASDFAAGGGRPLCDAAEKYTPGPMPPVQDANPTAIFDNIDLPLVAKWESHPGDKVLAVPFDTNVRSPGTHEHYRTAILTAVIEIVESEGISVASPRPSGRATSKSRTPTTFIIYNISKEQAETLLNRAVWSSKAVTFRVAPFATTCPTFLFAISNYSTTALVDVFQMVKNVWESDHTNTFVNNLLTETPLDEREKVASDIQHLIETMNLIRLNIKITGNTLSPRYNVYADCGEFSNDKTWSALRSFLLSTEYSALMQGRVSTELIPFRCTCCHSVDHPRGLCPFPSLPGWNGPPRETRGDRRTSGPPPERRNQKQRFTPFT